MSKTCRNMSKPSGGALKAAEASTAQWQKHQVVAAVAHRQRLRSMEMRWQKRPRMSSQHTQKNTNQVTNRWSKQYVWPFGAKTKGPIGCRTSQSARTAWTSQRPSRTTHLSMLGRRGRDIGPGMAQPFFCKQC